MQTEGQTAYQRREDEKLGAWLRYASQLVEARRELLRDFVEAHEQPHASNMIGQGTDKYDAVSFAMTYQTTNIGDVVGFVHMPLMRKHLDHAGSYLICGWLWYSAFKEQGADMSRIHHFDDVIQGKTKIDMQNARYVMIMDDINYREQQGESWHRLNRRIYEALLPMYDNRFTHIEFVVVG